ncbi:hypothetical protein J6590_028473 [Homalodisca vitripennis]|nr:hypothetical protein J6590_028473 [Homalodisca vitripennis]
MSTRFTIASIVDLPFLKPNWSSDSCSSSTTGASAREATGHCLRLVIPCGGDGQGPCSQATDPKNLLNLFATSTASSTSVAILFALSWLPLGIFSLTADVLYSEESFSRVSSQDLYVTLAVCHVTAMTSAVSNPVVYGWLNSNIRQELLQLLPSKCATVSGIEEATTKTALPTTTHRRESFTILLQNGDRPVLTQSPHTLVTVL